MRLLSKMSFDSMTFCGYAARKVFSRLGCTESTALAFAALWKLLDKAHTPVGRFLHGGRRTRWKF